MAQEVVAVLVVALVLVFTVLLAVALRRHVFFTVRRGRRGAGQR